MIIDNDLYINISSTCILTKGVKRGLVSDIQRKKVELVPNELIDILLENRNKKFSDIFNKEYSKDEINTIYEYFQFLIDREIVVLSKEKKFFKYNQFSNYKPPKKLLTAILDLNKKSNYSVKIAVEKIDNIGCNNIQLRMFDFKINIKKLKSLLDLFNNTSFRNVELLLMFDNDLIDEYKRVFLSYNRVNTVYFHSYNKKDKTEFINQINYIFTSEKILSSDFCGFIMPFYFNITPATYYIGENYNTCLYKKISIDVNGVVKNCPSMYYGFGDIDTVKLENVIKKPKFKKFWDITKNDISVCKGCEFRKICTDCRAYLKDEDLYDKPKKCDYDPTKLNW